MTDISSLNNEIKNCIEEALEDLVESYKDTLSGYLASESWVNEVVQKLEKDLESVKLDLNKTSSKQNYHFSGRWEGRKEQYLD